MTRPSRKPEALGRIDIRGLVPEWGFIAFSVEAFRRGVPQTRWDGKCAMGNVHYQKEVVRKYGWEPEIKQQRTLRFAGELMAAGK